MKLRRFQTLLALALLVAGGGSLTAQVNREWRKHPKVKPAEIVSGAPVGRIDYDPKARGDWQLFWYGGQPSIEYLMFKMDLAGREMQRWQDRLPGQQKPQALRSLAAAAALPAWRSLGPLKEPITGSRPDMDSGRLVDIVTHPGNPQILYVATAAGGVFKTTNADYASSGPWDWTNITDSIPSTSSGGSTSVGALAMSPTDPNTLYLGMGDREGSTVGNSASDCLGFYKSTDGGTNWSSPVLLGSTTLTYGILALDANTVLVCGNNGLYRSTNGGTSFTRITSGITGAPVWSIQAFTATDLVCTEWNTGAGSIYYSANAGLTWTAAAITGLTGTPSRMTVATSAASATTGWAIASLTTGSFAKGLLKTTDKGHTWSYIAAPVAPGSMFQVYPSQSGYSDGGQATYNQGIAVDPADVNKVWVGANPAMYRTTDGGVSWMQMSFGYDRDTVYAHPDYHCSAWSKTGPPTLYFGNDGGLCIVRDPYRSTIPRTGSSSSMASDPTFIDNRWNQGLNSYQIWKFGNTAATSPAGAKDSVVLGLQDNGTRARVDDGSGMANTTSFVDVSGGDGTAGHIHAVNGLQAMGSYPGLQIFRTTDGWSTAFYAKTGITDAGGSDAPFVVNLVSDLSDATGNTIYTHSNLNIYRTTNYGTLWAALGNSGIDSTRIIRNLGVSKSSPQTLAVVTSGGLGFITTNGGSSWTALGAFPNNSFSMSFVWFDTGDSQTMYAGSVAQVPASNHLWKSTNGGTSWTAIDGNPGFPAGVPVEALVNDPNNTSVLYAATDLGVYRSDNKGATWFRFGAGLPLVNVKDIYIAPDSSFLRAATFGRGVWEIALTSAPTGPTINTHPASQSVIAGATATFTVSATASAGSLSYQWKKNGSNVGTNSNSYTTPATTAGDNGALYTVVVTDANGPTTSNAAILTVISAPTVTSFNPATGPVGTPVTFTGTNFSGATLVKFNGTSATFNVVSPTSITTSVPVGALTGTVSVTNPAGTGTSAASFTVTVAPPVTVSVSPKPVTLLTGAQTLFTAVVTNSGNTAVTWNLSGSGALSASTATTTTYTAPATAGTATVTATSQADSTKSDSATITVKTRDVSGDGTTDILDLASFARAHGSTPASSNWNALCDLDGDGDVDDTDLALFLTGF